MQENKQASKQASKKRHCYANTRASPSRVVVIEKDDEEQRHFKAARDFFPDGRVVDNVKDIPTDATLVLGGVDFIIDALQHLGHATPTLTHYPKTLEKFLGRKMEVMDRSDIFQKISKGEGPLFVKATSEYKSSKDTKIIHDSYDMVFVRNDRMYHVSEVVEFVQECRVYVTDRKVIGIKRYKGTMSKPLIDEKIVEKAVELGPLTCALDFGLTKDGRTLLIEHNDAFSLGNYGISQDLYFSMIQSRWDQLTQRKKTSRH